MSVFLQYNLAQAMGDMGASCGGDVASGASAAGAGFGLGLGFMMPMAMAHAFRWPWPQAAPALPAPLCGGAPSLCGPRAPRYCGHCGGGLVVGASFCGHCGRAVVR